MPGPLPPNRSTATAEPPTNPPRLQVEQAGAGDVALVIGLVEEDVLAVARLRGGGILLQDAVAVDAVLAAQLAPELGADLRGRQMVVSGGGGGGGERVGVGCDRWMEGGGSRRRRVAAGGRRQRRGRAWLPHWPTCSVISSRGILLLRQGPAAP